MTTTLSLYTPLRRFGDARSDMALVQVLNAKAGAGKAAGRFSFYDVVDRAHANGPVVSVCDASATPRVLPGVVYEMSGVRRSDDDARRFFGDERTLWRVRGEPALADAELVARLDLPSHPLQLRIDGLKQAFAARTGVGGAFVTAAVVCVIDAAVLAADHKTARLTVHEHGQCMQSVRYDDVHDVGMFQGLQKGMCVLLYAFMLKSEYGGLLVGKPSFGSRVIRLRGERVVGADIDARREAEQYNLAGVLREAYISVRERGRTLRYDPKSAVTQRRHNGVNIHKTRDVAKHASSLAAAQRSMTKDDVMCAPFLLGVCTVALPRNDDMVRKCCDTCGSDAVHDEARNVWVCQRAPEHVHARPRLRFAVRLLLEDHTVSANEDVVREMLGIGDMDARDWIALGAERQQRVIAAACQGSYAS